MLSVASLPPPFEVIVADMPYVDINPHRSRPKWQAYAVLGVLLILTAAVVAAALTRM